MESNMSRGVRRVLSQGGVVPRQVRNIATILMLLPLLLQVSTATAQTSERSSNSAPDAANAADVEPLEQGRFHRLVNRAQKSDGGLLEFYHFQPVFGGLRSGAGTTVGLQFEPLSIGSPMYVSAAVRASRRGYWGTEGLFGLEKNPIVSYAYARYRHMPQEDFYGVGPNTPKSQHAVFRLDELLIGALVGAQAGKRLFYGGHLSFLENRIGPGTEDERPTVDVTYTSREAPGMFPGVSYVVGGLWVEYDTRDLPPLRAYGSRFSPAQWRLQGLSLDARRGFHASAEVRHYTDLDGGDYGFARLNVESQQYVPIRKGRYVVALRQFGSLSLPERDDVVPFYMMQSLGGVRSVRGFDNDRFRDLNVMLVNAELRWYAWGPLQLAIFADAGHVFNQFTHVNASDLEASYGAGARVQMAGKTFIRLEAARSREGITTYVNIGSFL